MTTMCQFRASSEAGVHVCWRCGTAVRVRSARGRIRARCQAIDLSGLTAAPAGGPCQHLGPSAGGLVACGTCAGNVRLKTFHCLAGHGQVTRETCRGCGDFRPIEPTNGPRVLLRFCHGLGDHVQLSVVLQHLRAAGVTVDLAAHFSKSTGFLPAGLIRNFYEMGHEPQRSQYAAVRDIHWHEPTQAYADSPSTKAEKCLRDVFGITPDLSLCGYRVGVDEETDRRVEQHARPHVPYVLLHYQGHTARTAKNLNEQAVARLVACCAVLGRKVWLLDFDERSGLRTAPGVVWLPRSHPIWSIHGGDAATLAALARRADLCVGIDSGPGKVFGATDTPTLIVWNHFHPIHYHGLSPNCVHLVPQRHERTILGDATAGARFFYRHYRHIVMQRNVCDELPAIAGRAVLDPQAFFQQTAVAQ